MNLIGPHEGNEFALLDSGHKNVALFYEIIPEELGTYRLRSDFALIEWDHSFESAGVSTCVPYVILYRNGFEGAAEDLRRLIERAHRGFDPAPERRIGEILGYPTEAIEHFIACLPSGRADP